MKKNYSLICFLCLIFFLFIYNLAYSSEFKWIRVGKYQTKVVDSGDQGESSGEGRFAYYYYDDFSRGGIDHAGWHLGTKGWTDEGGGYWPVKISGAGHGSADESMNTIPIPDDVGITIRRYVRTQPVPITVDGFRLDDPYPLNESDEVAPDKIPGTADIMVESTINTSMGITINQRVLGWSQDNHDDYIIFDWTFTNTGNVDIDSDIELSNQTLPDVYFLRANNFRAGGRSRDWRSCYGEYPSDTLRMSYSYPQRSRGRSYDDLGYPRSNGWMRRPHYIGEAMLHVDKSVDDDSDDPSQPQMTADDTAELLWIKNESNINSPSDHLQLYRVMEEGFSWWNGTAEMVGTYPGTHHLLRMDEQGIKFVRDFPWYVWRPCSYTSCGPYTLKPGDSFRIVWATVEAHISPQVGWRIGNAYNDGTCEPPPGCVFGVTDNMPPLYKTYPDLYEADSKASEYTNWAKDCWIFTGKDSLFTAAWNSQWNVQNNYDIPIAPQPPSVEIASRPNKIDVSWGSESETASDFAGYRVYRAIMTEDSTFFYAVFECGQGTANALTHSYEDAAAQRGIGYVYYVAAFDDGVGNKVDAHGRKESLESGRFLNQTTKPAYLTRPAGTLSTARVVPNPYNYGARELQFIGEPNKIMFLDIPAYCTIKIYSESGDLVKTLHHIDGSGDEAWGISAEEHSTTETGQLIVSGVYIALIEENNSEGAATGSTQFLKFVVVR